MYTWESIGFVVAQISYSSNCKKCTILRNEAGTFEWISFKLFSILCWLLEVAIGWMGFQQRPYPRVISAPDVSTKSGFSLRFLRPVCSQTSQSDAHESVVTIKWPLISSKNNVFRWFLLDLPCNLFKFTSDVSLHDNSTTMYDRQAISVRSLKWAVVIVIISQVSLILHYLGHFP